ncbi:MAG: eukaryotic translation initiation factor 2B beta subunit [Lentinula lateritia]|nr:MAG: eukaryotic translation initiation factor 2B beta subunit [Lentinula lateritia]
MATISPEMKIQLFSATGRRSQQLVGSRVTALETLLVLRQVVSKARFLNTDQLVNVIRIVGRTLVEDQPKEHFVGNTVRKVLHHIREEYHTAIERSTVQSSFSIAKFVLQGQPGKQTPISRSETRVYLKENDLDDLDSFARVLKPVLMEVIQDVFDELETIYDNISKNAKDHIHSECRTIQSFLKSAAHYRNYTAIVAEIAPCYGGRETAASLSSAGISTFLVLDSSIYALMSRVNKLLATTAARSYSTPVVACAGQFKLTPLWTFYHEHGALDFGDPSAVLGYEEGDLVDKVDIVNPYYDYVRPELLDVFIANYGDHPPSSIYRLPKETYDDEDNEL